MSQSNRKPVIVVTSGEPAGIGPDICLDLRTYTASARIVVVGDIELMRERAVLLNKKVKIRFYHADANPFADVLEVCHIPVRTAVNAGILNIKNAVYVLDLLDYAYKGI